jgi:tRNA nucleotidyltransferase (CCA-adding enzyme)
MLGRLQELDLLYKIHPELLWDEWLRRRFSNLPIELPGKEWGFFETDFHPQASWKNQRRLLAYTLWLIRLPANHIQAVALRIKIPRNQIGYILAAGKLYQDLPGLAPLPPSAVVNRLEDVPVFSIYAACLAASDFEPCELLSTYLTRWRIIQPTINGEDLKRFGLPPGPVYRKILKLLRDAWIDGSISTVEQEKILLDKLLDQEKQGLR